VTFVGRWAPFAGLVAPLTRIWTRHRARRLRDRTGRWTVRAG